MFEKPLFDIRTLTCLDAHHRAARQAVSCGFVWCVWQPRTELCAWVCSALRSARRHHCFSLCPCTRGGWCGRRADLTECCKPPDFAAATSSRSQGRTSQPRMHAQKRRTEERRRWSGETSVEKCSARWQKLFAGNAQRPARSRTPVLSAQTQNRIHSRRLRGSRGRGEKSNPKINRLPALSRASGVDTGTRV
jgi:hypothetical protein